MTSPTTAPPPICACSPRPHLAAAIPSVGQARCSHFRMEIEGEMSTPRHHSDLLLHTLAIAAFVDQYQLGVAWARPTYYPRYPARTVVNGRLALLATLLHPAGYSPPRGFSFVMNSSSRDGRVSALRADMLPRIREMRLPTIPQFAMARRRRRFWVWMC